MEINVEIEGFERVLRHFQNMGVNCDLFVENALEKGAKVIQSEIKVNTPVGQINGTGDLRNSISVEKTDRLKFQVGTNKNYAVPVEYGTGKFGDPAVPHTTKDSWVYFNDAVGHFVTDHGHEPTHFMHNAFIASKDDAVQKVRKELQKWLT